jgi:hypothetical protein
MFMAIFWLAYVPKNAKTILWAKIHRQDVLIGASDSGKLPFMRGHTEGPGVFRSHDGFVIDFIPRGSEAWINKTFHADKIGYLLAYVGKAVAGSFETVAVLTAHELLQEHKNKINDRLAKLRKANKGKSELEMQTVFRDFLKNNPEGKLLLEQLKAAQANVTFKQHKNDNGKKKVRKVMQRLTAILLDPRIIQSYFTNTVQPSQARHVHDVGYRQGYRDGNNPMAKFTKVFLVLLIVIIPIAIIALLLLGGGTAA